MVVEGARGPRQGQILGGAAKVCGCAAKDKMQLAPAQEKVVVGNPVARVGLAVEGRRLVCQRKRQAGRVNRPLFIANIQDLFIDAEKRAIKVVEPDHLHKYISSHKSHTKFKARSCSRCG